MIVHVVRRPTWEGGQYDGDESGRRKALCRAIELGADYIDVELKVCFYYVSFVVVQVNISL